MPVVGTASSAFGAVPRISTPIAPFGNGN